ncbi:hypothetical protein GDO78_018872 [Eleutherodactylus coqui]|uniref:C2H2-type domain-containing protein n=3 Tax=Eleutherodactylus coqui TaxID=57060 RepID=A0A8J6BK08_ELECQ|nr:hypothetical protein GDO78_018872 [Eleutherodactylus coqui]
MQEPQGPPAVGTLLPQCKEEEIPVEIGSGNHFSMTPPETRGRNVTSHSGVKKEKKRKARDSQAEAGDKPLPIRCKEEPNTSEIILGPPTSWKIQPDSPHVLVPVQHKNGDNPSNLDGSTSSDIHPIAVIVKPQSVLSLRPPRKDKSDQQPHPFSQEPGGDTPSSSLMKFEDGDGNELAVVYVCKQCGQNFENKIDLTAHEQMLHCALCQKCFKDKSALVVHQWAFHMPKPNTKEPKYPPKDEGPFSCNECGKSLLSKSGFERHQSIHTGAFPCPECGKCLTDRSGLIRHRRTHTVERSFPCLDCGRRFTRRNHLMSHQSVHKESISPTAENDFQ